MPINLTRPQAHTDIIKPTPRSIAKDLVSDIIGFDLGHGESALTLAKVVSVTEPQVLEVQSSRSFITAVAEHPKRGIIIGEDAYKARQLDSLRVRFKSAELNNPNTRLPIKLFASKIRSLLDEKSLIPGPEQCYFVVGCPSGWKQQTRDQYAALMREAGLDPVSVMAESRAAFLHAREAQDLHISGDTLLDQSVLIIDVGSSTTDFTLVRNLKEHYIDFGDVRLGAGLLEEAMLEYVLSKFERRAELQAIFRRYPHYQAICELACRRVKEYYFSAESRYIDDPATESLKIPSRPPMYFDIEFRQADMQHILKQPLLRGKSWMDAYREELIAAREKIAEQPPGLVFLTGGASRMEFTRQIAQQVFPDALIVRGREPELTIAKGLAWAGRIDRKAEAFEREINAFLNSGKLKYLLDSRLPNLLGLLAERMAYALPEEVVIPAFQEWQRGKLKTLAELEQAIETRAEEWIQDPSNTHYFNTPVQAWFFQKVMPYLEKHIHPLCDKYNIPRTAFSPPRQTAWQGKVSASLVTNRLRVFDGLNFTGVIVSILMANVLGGGGVALIMQGPVGLILGFIIGIMAFAISRRQADNWIKNMEFPLLLRRIETVKSVSKKLQQKAPDIQAEILRSLEQDTETLAKVSIEIDASLKIALQEAVRKATLLIR